MAEYVARIGWQGLEVASGRSEGGEMSYRLEDFVIVTVEEKEREGSLIEKLVSKGLASLLKPNEFQKLREETDRDPAGDEIVSRRFLKSIQLSPNFNIGLADHPEQQPVSGFGLVGDIGVLNSEHGERHSFSWDWFNVSSSGKATKLQEAGDIRFDQAVTANGLEITTMVFETDVSLRIYTNIPRKLGHPDWRILIHKGSEIRWPSLIAGRIVANGFLS